MRFRGQKWPSIEGIKPYKVPKDYYKLQYLLFFFEASFLFPISWFEQNPGPWT